jgi:hypothetical protein
VTGCVVGTDDDAAPAMAHRANRISPDPGLIYSIRPD